MNVFVMMEYKNKIKFAVLGHFAECHGHSTRQSWKNGRSENRFFSFAECHNHDTRQRFFLKKIQTLPSASQRALGKEILKKNICRVPGRGHSAKKFCKKK